MLGPFCVPHSVFRRPMTPEPSLCSHTYLRVRSAPEVERPGSPTLYHPLYGAAAALVDEDEYDSDDPDYPPDPRRVRAAWEGLQASTVVHRAAAY